MPAIDRYINNITIAFEAILANKLRSVLTALGIIFGVAAVISMLAIGNGARQEILEQIKLVGVNNIVITPIIPENGKNGEEESDNGNGKNPKRKFSPGLTLEDYTAIMEVIPTVHIASPEITLNSSLVKSGKRVPSKVSGVTSGYFQLYNLLLESGTLFSDEQEEKGLAVCIIGGNVRTKLFSTQDPLNQYIKCGNTWLKVIGVLERSRIASTTYEEAGITLMDDYIYIPVRTMLLRIKNRGLVNSGSIKQENMWVISGDHEQEQNIENKNYHQLDRIIVQVKETGQLENSAGILQRMLFRRHQEIQDFEITIPELLLKQQQKTKDIFNIVLGAIASISLIVGGIGIMNIMFASVMERIREIGIRLAIGANKKDIIAQFMSEAVLISVSGGLIGVIVGVIISKFITHFTGILTIVSWFSVLIAFGVSVAVGIIFGYTPAKKASEKDPIESVRHE